MFIYALNRFELHRSFVYLYLNVKLSKLVQVVLQVCAIGGIGQPHGSTFNVQVHSSLLVTIPIHSKLSLV